MPTITLEFTDSEIESMKELLCREKETLSEAIKRIIVLETKNRKFQELFRN